MLRLTRRALIAVADTGTCQRWHAKDLEADGLIRPACATRPAHTCTRTTCPGWMRWRPTQAGAEAITDARNHDTPPGEQMTLFTQPFEEP